MSLSRQAINKPFWALSREETLEVLRAVPAGLTEVEAEERRKVFGRNSLVGDGDISKIAIFLNQLKSPLILILIFAGIITLFLKEFGDAAFIMAAVLVNSLLGFYQENKAEESLKRLRAYVKNHATVKREDRYRTVSTEELVPGDIVRLVAGDLVPADVRLMRAQDFLVDQAVLTGESLSVAKQTEETDFQAPLIDQKSVAFMGSSAVEGWGEGVVIATGSDTQFGRIASLVKESRETQTPLQQKISKFSFQIGLFVLAGIVLLFVVGLSFGQPILDMFLTSVAIGIAAVPEGLPVALTVILAVGVERLAKKKGVVRRLLAAETLGSASVILTDKTGTLTEARMVLKDIEIFGREEKDSVFKLAVLSTKVIVENPESPPSGWILNGTPLEKAIVSEAAKRGVVLTELSEEEVIERLPFNSKAKYSGLKLEEKENFTASILGAPEIILEFCLIQEKEKEEMMALINRRAYSGERVLGLAVKRFKGKPRRGLRQIIASGGFSFLAVFGFRDPVRKGMKNVVSRIEKAGVKTVIVTGDHRGTAESVARELGFVVGDREVVDGPELASMSEEDLTGKLSLTKVFSRVTPEDKLRIVAAYQKTGETVAMIGDGVNDAPALKQADIGAAVGSGTDVAKDVADLVLLDDNFSTLVEAIEEGRRIFSTIRKVLVYLLSDLLDEIFLIGGALLTGLPLPLNALQILWVNMIEDSFPSIALSFDRIEDGQEERSNRKESLFDAEMKFLIWVIGVVTSIILFVAYFVLIKAGFDTGVVRTFIFVSFSAYSLFLIFSLRSLRLSIFSYNPFSNKYLVGAVFLGVALLLAGVYWPPLQGLLKNVVLGWPWLLGAAGIVLINILGVEFGKWLYRRKNK